MGLGWAVSEDPQSIVIIPHQERLANESKNQTIELSTKRVKKWKRKL